jgi:hypothetical protein
MQITKDSLIRILYDTSGRKCWVTMQMVRPNAKPAMPRHHTRNLPNPYVYKPWRRMYSMTAGERRPATESP